MRCRARQKYLGALLMTFDDSLIHDARGIIKRHGRIRESRQKRRMTSLRIMKYNHVGLGSIFMLYTMPCRVHPFSEKGLTSTYIHSCATLTKTRIPTSTMGPDQSPSILFE
jgi:hypothetical protein